MLEIVTLEKDNSFSEKAISIDVETVLTQTPQAVWQRFPSFLRLLLTMGVVVSGLATPVLTYGEIRFCRDGDYESHVLCLQPVPDDGSGGGVGPSDADVDGIPNGQDNCPFVANPGQQDKDGEVRGMPVILLLRIPAADGRVLCVMRSVQKEGGDEAIRDDYSLHPHAPCWPLKWARCSESQSLIPVTD